MSRIGQPRNVTKANVTVEERDGRRVVVKDFSARPWWVRALIGRRTLKREARAYERLANVEGIPASYGQDGPHRLVIEYVDAEPLRPALHGQVREETFDRAAEILEQVHARGVAIADLHRSNILIDAQEQPHLIDFAMARLTRPDRPGFLSRALMRLDRHALARIRAQFLGTPEPTLDGWLGTTYRLARRLKP